MRSALENIGDDQGMVERLLLKFRDHARPTLATFQQALERNALDVLRREAHSLKGSSGYVAANDLREAAIALQFACDSLLEGKEPEQPLPVLVNCVREEVLRVVDEIAKLVPGATAPAVVKPRGPAAQQSHAVPSRGACGSAPLGVVCSPSGLLAHDATSAAISAVPAPKASSAEAGPTQVSAPTHPGFAEASDPTILHWKEALEHFGREEDILRRLLRKFCDRSGPTLEGLQQAVLKGDMDTLRREAHSLSGSCAYIGAASLQAAAIALEDTADQPCTQSGGDGTGELIAAAMDRVKQEQKRLLLAIEYKLAHDERAGPAR